MAKEYFFNSKTCLYPVSFLYGMGVYLRNKLFDWKVLHSKSYDIPVICIGNLTVGGTGKTPHTEYLVELLRDEFGVAVLSRGYKRKTKGYILADAESNAQSIGDEPYQIKKKYPEICIAVDENRRHGIEKLACLKQFLIDVIILDDAFQHRYVQPGISILLTDYYRLLCNDVLLPVGYLREPVSGKKRADMVIVTKCPKHLSSIDYDVITKRLKISPYQQLYFSVFDYGDLTPVFPNVQTAGKRKLENVTEDESILLVTGIASPVAIIEILISHTQNIDILSFADHHNFSEPDIALIEKRFINGGVGKKIIVTTEKDAARLICHPEMADEIKKQFYVLPVKVKFLKEQQNIFNENITNYVRKNRRTKLR
ncbi:Tetraacyldisaccharide 4'-kinase [termite gut metagenome]|uniref:tetraacyldisaccharide 4'-kinase n=1 Tax=termite gut metagenome TaxID=433724 RepID=A0A5J4QHD4_9ZZZZ